MITTMSFTKTDQILICENPFIKFAKSDTAHENRSLFSFGFLKMYILVDRSVLIESLLETSLINLTEPPPAFLIKQKKSNIIKVQRKANNNGSFLWTHR